MRKRDYDEEEWEDEEDEDEEEARNELLEETEAYGRYLLKQIRKCEVDDPRYYKLQQAYEAVTREIVNLKEGDSQDATRVAAEKSQNAWMWQTGVTVLSNFAGPLIGNLLNRQNVKSVTDYEKTDILSTKATKFMR